MSYLPTAWLYRCSLKNALVALRNQRIISRVYKCERVNQNKGESEALIKCTVELSVRTNIHWVAECEAETFVASEITEMEFGCQTLLVS